MASQELTFNKSGEVWTAEHRVEADFNLHLEKPGGSSVQLYQTTVEGRAWDPIKEADIKEFEAVADIDFSGIIYPKWIRIEATDSNITAIVTVKD